MFRLLLLLIALGNIEKLETQFASGARRETKAHLEGRSANVLFRGNVAPELEPDVFVVAVNVDGVRGADFELR